MSATTDSIVTWTAGRHTRIGRVLGVDRGTAIIRGTDEVTRCVFVDQLRPAQVSPMTRRRLGVPDGPAEATR